MIQTHAAFKWAVAGVAACWVSLPASVTVLLSLMALDYASGLGAAFINRTLHSRESINGLIRKTLVLLLLASAHLASKALGIGYDLGSAVAMAFIFNELISITENCAEAKVPVPQVLLDALAKAKSLTGSSWSGQEKRKNLSITYSGDERRAPLPDPVPPLDKNPNYLLRERE